MSIREHDPLDHPLYENIYTDGVYWSQRPYRTMREKIDMDAGMPWHAILFRRRLRNGSIDLSWGALKPLKNQ